MVFDVLFFISGFLFAAGILNESKALLIVAILMVLLAIVAEMPYISIGDDEKKSRE